MKMIFTLVLVAICSAVLAREMHAQKIPEDDGIVWNTAIEKRLAVRTSKRTTQPKGLIIMAISPVQEDNP